MTFHLTLRRDEFRTLVNGGTVRLEPVSDHHGLPLGAPIEIILADIGHAMMRRDIADAEEIIEEQAFDASLADLRRHAL